MNKTERVRAVLAGEQPDRVPASFWFHFPEGAKHGTASVKSHMDYLAETDVDFLKIFNEHPYQTEFDIKEPADWGRLRPAPLSSPFFQAMLDETRAIVEHGLEERG